MGWTVRLLFEPRDLWVGVYWDRIYEVYEQGYDLYICLLPMLPIKVSCRKRWRIGG
jgi:hypothetical protein